MRKTYPHNVLSDKVCVEQGCRQRLKKRLVESKPTLERCYRHHVQHEAKRNHHICVRYL